MGGIPTNYNTEVVTVSGKDHSKVVPGLMAIGEAACVSVHGANRLGSNSLLDLVVFGRAAANRCAEIVTPGAPHRPFDGDNGTKAIDRLDHFRHAKGGTPTAKLRDRMQRTMQDHAAVFRTTESMNEGVAKINECYSAKEDIGISDRTMVFNTDLVETLELDNLLSQGGCIYALLCQS